MKNPRFDAVEKAGDCHKPVFEILQGYGASKEFGANVFTRAQMQKVLPKEVFANVVDAMESRDKIKPEYSDTIALAIKEWALSKGATHYCHWFQPLTGAAAEKHDAFIDWSKNSGEVIEKFTGDQLIQGEPDASSFPSGGLRNTYEARGYTGWDPTSPVFLWKGGDGLTLCIPTVFFSWTGEVLDEKIPLLRSDETLNAVALRLLKLTGIKANRVYSTLGLEQEYFVIDRSLRNLRPDLLLLGKTVYGAPSPKGQELQDHYLGSVKDRILSFMQDFESEAIRLAIPVKTRHNEVAPAQHEVAPVFEKASLAIDHNIILMQLMRHVAVRHQLSCLLHEKPFKGLNGSGKHSNWSLSTDTGINLLDPSDTPDESLHFLILLTAILSGIHRHSALLRASVGSASNDSRLGGHEAPPAIISVFLGNELETLLGRIESNKRRKEAHSKEAYDLGLLQLPNLRKDYTDRNRTSPFAFTGNKFEFRAVGALANPSFSITVLNAIIAESLNEILDKIEAETGGKKVSGPKLFEAVIPVLNHFLKVSKPIRYFGNNYSDEWKKEAKKRGLPNLESALDAFPAFTSAATKKLFKGILTEQELKSRYEINVEAYLLNLKIEANLMIDLFKTSILPAAYETQKEWAKSLSKTVELLKKESAIKGQKALFTHFVSTIEKAIQALEKLEKTEKNITLANAKALRDQMDALRVFVDEIEEQADDFRWPLPKYRELLFIV